MKMFLAPFPMVYTFRRLIRFARVCSHVDDLDTINLKELLESLILVINLKRLLNVIKEWDKIWISCDSLLVRL